jgi:putative hydrolase
MPFGFDLSGFDFSQIDVNFLASALQSSGPLNWEIASQIAGVVATGGEDEPSEAARSELDNLAHAAQTSVVAETGLAATFAAPVRVLDRNEWATLHLDVLKPVLERFATTLGGAFNPEDLVVNAPMEGAEAFASILPMLGPLLLGVQAGSMIGYLAQHALGRYDLPLPAGDDPSLCFVVRNIDEFESDWSLERTDLRFYVAIHEVVHAAERSVPWVRQRLVDLATEYVSAYEVDASTLSMRFGDIDPSDPSSLQALTDNPDQLLGAMRSDRQAEILQRVRVLHAVLESYADVVLARVGTRLIPSFDRIHEAMARHRIERGGAERFVEGLLGLATAREDYERGDRFCEGVIERAGIEGLHRLWHSPEMIPTPNELDAPGLWLARIDLDLE